MTAPPEERDTKVRRNCFRSLLYYIYYMLRVEMVTFWFYFAPFLVFYGSYILPSYLRWEDGRDVPRK